MHVRTSRRLAVAAAVAAAMFPLGPAAVADKPTTTVVHAKNVTETFVDVGPDCAGTGLYEITVTYNAVSKESFTDAGDVHSTFTQTGTFSAEPVGGGATQGATGHFTVWGGFNSNVASGTVNGTFTFNGTGRWDDGSRLAFHAVDHFNTTPKGVIFEWSKCHDTV
jgi:hypothetical protein